MTSSLFFLGIALGVLLVVGLMLRSRLLREKCAALWVLVGVLVVVLALFPGMLEVLSRSVGVAVPSNLLFALSILLLFGVTLHLSLEVSRLDEETRVLAEEAAIARLQIEELSRRVADLEGTTDRTGDQDEAP